MPPADLPDLPAYLERYERPLVRYAQSILGDLESARDVVQDTFIKFVHARREPADGTAATANWEAWLFTVCRNRALDHQRKLSRIVPMEHPEDRPTDEPSPAATLEREESARSLFQMLDSLSPNQREVIRLKFQNDLSYKEIAEVTQLSVTNVGFLLHTGLKKLRTLLQEAPPDDWPLPVSVSRQP